jgi:hypothetical protein
LVERRSLPSLAAVVICRTDEMPLCGMYPWFAMAFKPGQGPRRSLAPGATYKKNVSELIFDTMRLASTYIFVVASVADTLSISIESYALLNTRLSLGGLRLLGYERAEFSDCIWVYVS